MARPAKTDKKTLIIGIGDSYTAGTPHFESPLEFPPDGKGDPQGQYAYWIMSKKPDWEVLNYGMAGQNSTEIRLRVDEALQRAPRFIIIFAGTNDIVQGNSPEQAAENLLFMYQLAKTNHVIPVAVTLPMYDRASQLERAKIEVLNRWIKKQAEILRIPIADATQAFASEEDPLRFSDSPDGYHPAVGGYRTLGMKLIEAIEPVNKAFR